MILGIDDAIQIIINRQIDKDFILTGSLSVPNGIPRDVYIDARDKLIYSGTLQNVSPQTYKFFQIGRASCRERV